MTTTQGRRVPDSSDGAGVVYARGDYGRIGGAWHACTPAGMLGNLSEHDIVEHEDGTITVSPSILLDSGRPERHWHGFLERGVWREC